MISSWGSQHARPRFSYPSSNFRFGWPTCKCAGHMLLSLQHVMTTSNRWTEADERHMPLIPMCSCPHVKDRGCKHTNTNRQFSLQLSVSTRLSKTATVCSPCYHASFFIRGRDGDNVLAPPSSFKFQVSLVGECGGGEVLAVRRTLYHCLR